MSNNTNVWAKNVFAFPLPWFNGKTKGRAAYMRKFKQYHRSFKNIADADWAIAGKDLMHALDEKTLKKRDILVDAMKGLVILAECNDRSSLERFIQTHAYKFAASCNDKDRLAEMASEFASSNKAFLSLEAIEWMKAREATPPYGGILADNVGAGKTYTIAGLLKHSPLWPVLILVPKSLIWQWVSVIDEACLDEELHVVPKASKKIDEVMGKDKNKLIVATHGCLLDPPKEMTSRSWGRIIVDEAHCAKNSKSITSRSLRKLRAHAKWAITATPVQNCRDDLLAIAGALGITSQDTNFVREVFVGRASHASHASHASLELPPLFVKVIEVPLTGDLEVKAYQDATKLLAKVDDSSSSNMCRMAFLRCRQAATHPCLFYESMANSMNESSHSLSLDLRLEAQRARDLPVAKASSKIGYLVKDVLAHPDEAAVVFCEWSSEMGLVIDALRSAGANAFSYNGKLSVQERQDVLTTFRKCAKPAVLVAQIKCASAGLNIQCASRAYIMRPQWNPATERQVVGRLHRSGQEREVHVMRLVAKFEGHKTVDELTLNKQQGKLRCITEVMKDDEMERVLGKIGFDLALV